MSSWVKTPLNPVVTLAPMYAFPYCPRGYLHFGSLARSVLLLQYSPSQPSPSPLLFQVSLHFGALLTIWSGRFFRVFSILLVFLLSAVPPPLHTFCARSVLPPLFAAFHSYCFQMLTFFHLANHWFLLPLKFPFCFLNSFQIFHSRSNPIYPFNAPPLSLSSDAS